ncbi:MAG: hypothetical protein ACKO69_08170, partial [Limnohabitans sp.]
EHREIGPRSEPSRPPRAGGISKPAGAHPGSRPPPPRRDRKDRGLRSSASALVQTQAPGHDHLDSQPPAHFEDDFQPRANAHLGTQSGVNAFGHKSGGSAGRQPDPTMTSVDMLSRNNRGGGGGGGKGKRRGGGKPGGFGGGAGGGKRGGGYRP